MIVMVHVHRLDADPTGPDHLGQVHAVAQQAGLDVLLGHVHRDGRVLVQEPARLDEDLLPVAQGALEHVAVAVEQDDAGLVGR